MGSFPTHKVSTIIQPRITVKPVTLQLPPAHPEQYKFLTMLDEPGVRFAVGACGTKFGKTYGTTAAIVQRAWDVRDSMNWWISPTFNQAKMAFTMVMRLLPKGMYQEYRADLRLVILHPDGTERSFIDFKSADNPDSLRGYGVNFFVMDEAARCVYDAWISLYTTVTQTMGKGYIISTPKGRNWFYDVYQWGDKNDSEGNNKFIAEGIVDDHPDFLSIRMPTWMNPHVKLAAVEAFRRNMPEDVFEQEVAAKFLTDSAGVFRGINQCIYGELEEPDPGKNYVMGVDLARIRDYSVIIVMDRKTRHVVHFERFNQIRWDVQYSRIIAAARKYRAPVCIDATGVGDPIVEAIQNSGISVIPYKIGGSAAKQHLIDKLRVSIENGGISFPHIPVLKRELEIYEYRVSPSGTVQFSAPPNQHDDCVMSLALCNEIADTGEFVYRYRNIRGV